MNDLNPLVDTEAKALRELGDAAWAYARDINRDVRPHLKLELDSCISRYAQAKAALDAALESEKK